MLAHAVIHLWKFLMAFGKLLVCSYRCDGRSRDLFCDIFPAAVFRSGGGGSIVLGNGLLKMTRAWSVQVIGSGLSAVMLHNEVQIVVQ